MMPVDRRVVYAAGFLRATANGLIGVIAGIYLAKLGFSPAAFGVVLAAGSRDCGRRGGRHALGRSHRPQARPRAARARSAAGGVVIAAASDLAVLAAAAFLGMMNSLGKDRAAAAAFEQAILPGTVDDAGRTRVFAWYNVTQDIGHGLGAALAAAPDSRARGTRRRGRVAALRRVLYAVLLPRRQSPTRA